MDGIGNSITLRLQGDKSNRDAIGAAVTVETGSLRQTKYLQAGSGFLSQHTKELFFGLGKNEGAVRATTVHWPSGMTQTYDALPSNRRIEIHEGSRDFTTKSFAATPQSWLQPGDQPSGEVLPSSVGTWLVEPVRAVELLSA